MAAVENKPVSSELRLVTEVPHSLKQLARLIARFFYANEDILIVDMLVRNPCMKEDDIGELLKMERKQLRARLAILRNEKIVQVRLKMETGPDAKAQKVNYYFINYKTFVNLVKYKLDIMRKRMETEERDATSRASFKCSNCFKTFTDLNVDQLIDFTTQELRCTFCASLVEEDASALPKKDSRLMLARFNEQFKILFDLLREADNIKLAPELLEPKPVDIDIIRGKKPQTVGKGVNWTGEATRTQGFGVDESHINIDLGNGKAKPETIVKPVERPIWLSESTVMSPEELNEMKKRKNNESNNASATQQSTNSSSIPPTTNQSKLDEEIMNMLLTYEDRGPSKNKKRHSHSDEENKDNNGKKNYLPIVQAVMDTLISVNGTLVRFEEITQQHISKFTPQEKEHYLHVYAEKYIPLLCL